MMSQDHRELRSLLIGILVGCAVTVFLWPEQQAQTSPLELAAPSGSAVGPATDLARHVPTQHDHTELPQARVAIEQLEDGETIAAASPAIDLEGHVDVLPARMPSEMELNKRYGKMSYKELVGAERSLNFILHDEAKAFLKKKLERGLFTTHVIANGTPLEQHGQFPDGSPRSTLVQYHSLGDGLQEAWMAEIHPSEQPVLQARHAEIEWVSRRRQSLVEE